LLIERVEDGARRDRHFRRAVSGVWGRNRMNAAVWNRVQACLGSEPRL
jgi:hypothetical protein